MGLAPAACWSGQALHIRHVVRAADCRRAVARGRQPAQAAGGEGGSGGGSGSRRRPRLRPRWCERVDILVPNGWAEPEGMSYRHLPFMHVTQRHLNAIMEVCGTVGFELANRSISRRKNDLPEGGAVKLVLPPDHPWAIQQRKLEQARDSAVLAEELGIGSYLQKLASTENAGCPVTTLQTEPFTDAQGERYEQFVAAVVAGGTLYVAELKRMLDEESVRDALLKLIRIRRAHRGSGPPDLAAALQGVTQTKMFLVGERVEEGEEGQLLIAIAQEGGLSVLLPSGQGLELVSTAPAVQL